VEKMKLERKDILAIRNHNYSWKVKNMVESGAIANVITFDEVGRFTHTQCTLKRAEDDKKQF
jgi:hypothetical protein